MGPVYRRSKYWSRYEIPFMAEILLYVYPAISADCFLADGLGRLSYRRSELRFMGAFLIMELLSK